MLLRWVQVFKDDFFYKRNTRFKATLKPTIAESWRKYWSCWMERRYWGTCPKSPRNSFADDYKYFKDAYWKQTVYVIAYDCYSSEASCSGLRVVTPAYDIDGGKISKIYNISRGYYPSAMFNLEMIDMFPRESGDITPDEKYKHSALSAWRDANIFVALWWHKVVQWKDTTNASNKGMMSWTWKPILNEYNPWYLYDNWKLILIEEVSEDEDNN